MTKFFGSDQHFDHKNVIEFCKRPYASVDHMNVELVKNHNMVVKPDDEFFCIGDFSFAHKQNDIESILNQMNGKKYLIPGNHDHKQTRKASGWTEVFSDHIVELKLDLLPVPLVLCHYPIASWNRKFHGAIHLYGHVHSDGQTQLFQNAVDVGVDAWDYRPVTFNEIKSRCGRPGSSEALV